MTTYRNPILPGFNPDPSICRVGDDYFIATSTFQFFPGVPIYHSRDLVNWKLIGHALNRRSQLDLRTAEGGGGIFAPTLRYWKGRWYMTTCSAYRIRFGSKDPFVTPRGFYVSTDDIFDDSKWSEPVFFDMLGIDQDLFFDDKDDKVYLSTTARIFDPKLPRYGFDTGVFISEVDMDSGRIKTRPKFLRQSPIGIGIAEGSHIFKKDGYYYLITAEGGTESLHQEWVFRSKQGPYGPWEAGPEGTVNPMVFQGKFPDEEIQYTGHMDIVDAPDGRWWAVMLGVREQREGPKKDNEVIWSQLGRETFLCPVEWEEGWPVVNQREPLRVEGVEGTGLRRVEEDVEWRDDFDQKDLELGWYTVRTPNTSFYTFTEKPSTLTIHGSPYSITDDESPSMLLRRQDTFEGVWHTQLDFEPSIAGEEAGTTVWWSKWAFASVGLRGKGEDPVRREIVFKYTMLENDDVHETVVDAAHIKGPVRFAIHATRFSYDLYFGPGVEDTSTIDVTTMTKAGHLSARVLTKQGPLHSVMTGTHFGLYSMGAHHEPSFAPAHFSYAAWKGKRA
ncbi:hypothetical protein QFC21_004190 [Naganishia friedmannii]|uniref:Uncharacterized protein n=1 Tax=Naganishia friedmannii TaxID=89922 RepID=A0ACC2VIS7_9TREE|nr:hypothetical protein QFC21_004190 [Naganishia friedmannii]